MKRIIHVAKQYEAMITPFRSALIKLMYIMIGVIIGMLVVYLIVPVKFKNNAEPVQLDDGYRDQWIKGIAAEYQLNGDENEVKDKLIAAGVTADEVAALRDDNAGSQVGDWLAQIEPIAEDVSNQATEKADQYPDPGFFSAIAPILTFLGVAILGLLAALYLSVFPDPITMIRWRLQKGGEPTSADIERQKRAQARELSSQKTAFDVPPVVQFMSSYNTGDNFYDDSFAIETEDSKFLGECGSSIAETIGGGDPKKVTATEVWVFSQNDIATLAKIVVTEHAYNDPALRAKLETRGELVLAEKGATSLLESKSLRTQIRVVEMNYLDDPTLPPNSVFERLAVEIAVWEIEGASASSGAGNDMGMAVPPPVMNIPPAQSMPPQAPPPQQMPPQQMPAQDPYAAPPQAMPPQAPPPQQMPPQPMPPQAPPMQQPPAQQPSMSPPPQQAPSMQPPMQAPPQQMPPRAPQQPGGMQPGGMQPPPPQRQAPPMQPPTMQPPRQQPPSMQPPQAPPPSPYGDTNY